MILIKKTKYNEQIIIMVLDKTLFILEETHKLPSKVVKICPIFTTCLMYVSEVGLHMNA